MNTTGFHKIVQDHVPLHDNITIVEDVEQFKIDDIENGVIMVWVNWSVGYLNCKYSIECLQDKKYSGQIFIIDIDTIQADFQKTVLKSRLNGWGEIFLIKNGQVIESFLGKESSIAFKTYIDKYADTYSR